jgi:hypothetical protein
LVIYYVLFPARESRWHFNSHSSTSFSSPRRLY